MIGVCYIPLETLGIEYGYVPASKVEMLGSQISLLDSEGIEASATGYDMQAR